MKFFTALCILVLSNDSVSPMPSNLVEVNGPFYVHSSNVKRLDMSHDDAALSKTMPFYLTAQPVFRQFHYLYDPATRNNLNGLSHVNSGHSQKRKFFEKIRLLFGSVQNDPYLHAQNDPYRGYGQNLHYDPQFQSLGQNDQLLNLFQNSQYDQHHALGQNDALLHFLYNGQNDQMHGFRQHAQFDQMHGMGHNDPLMHHFHGLSHNHRAHHQGQHDQILTSILHDNHHHQYPHYRKAKSVFLNDQQQNRMGNIQSDQIQTKGLNLQGDQSQKTGYNHQGDQLQDFSGAAKQNHRYDPQNDKFYDYQQNNSYHQYDEQYDPLDDPAHDLQNDQFDDLI